MNIQQSLSVTRIKQIISLIDLTNLDSECDETALESLCHQASTPMGNVAAICIWPRFVASAKAQLASDSPIRIATVVNFPSGTEPASETCQTIEAAIVDGATEIDYVMPYHKILANKPGEAAASIQRVRSCIPNTALLKVILETGELRNSEQVQAAATIAIDHGADFIKTSTGKVPVNATPSAANTMLNAIDASGREVGFKAAGGLKTVMDADGYLQQAEAVFGVDWINPNHFRFGASSLLNDALSRIGIESSLMNKHSTQY
ncbi:MAG: deoxyribose-phosphate aldolase [Gammaproteobacteria bacterium]|nr:deoxyribose-phosphate aldolase [Gammaproteobacteria bacterium]